VCAVTVCAIRRLEPLTCPLSRVECVQSIICRLDPLSRPLCCLLHRRHLGLLHIQLRFPCNTTLVFLPHILVCRDIERDKEHKIRAQDYVSGDGGKWLARAGADMW